MMVYFKSILILFVLVFVSGAKAEGNETKPRDAVGAKRVSEAPECSEHVDMADDINFAGKIVECDNEPVLLYDPKSRQKFFSRRAPAVKIYKGEQKAKADTADPGSVQDGGFLVEETVGTGVQPATGSSEGRIGQREAVHVDGAVFITRAPFSAAKPQPALVQIYRDMMTYCPLGWQKEREWSEPAGADYHLYYEFSCLSTQ
ncbi:MAG TPA: hypothetical protein DCZ13_13950 [Porticoccaceae bacterium]|nr:hypothetical protein [Porticoccaceae bacterium]